jgi:hypothetical protein
MEELKDLAAKAKEQLNIKYNADGVKFLEGFIERNKSEIPKEQWSGLINTCGAFLGQCIIKNFGGKWVREDDEQVAVVFGDGNKIYPFAKVNKQFENGLEDSIFSLFTLIPTVYKIEPRSPRKTKWWRFWR